MIGRALSILLIEDEAMIRMMVADMVETLGHRVAAEAGNMDQAMELARSADFEFAIIDMNLNGTMTFPVADTIAARDIPFLFASGYAPTMATDAHRAEVVLQKPFTIDRLESAIGLAMRSRA
jgi:DNA-binding NtrC family response regulator